MLGALRATQDRIGVLVADVAREALAQPRGGRGTSCPSPTKSHEPSIR